MADKIPAEVRFTSIDCRAIYKEPIIQRWNKSGEITQAVFRALREWNLSLDQVSETPTAANLGEVVTTFQLLQGRFVFRVGLGFASLFVWNPLKPEVDLIERMSTAGIEAVRLSAQVELDRYELTLDMHAAPTGRTISEVTRPLVAPALANWIGDDLGAYGFRVHKSDTLWHVDSSDAFADSLFLRVSRRFAPGTAIGEMAAAIRSEEANLLNILGLSVAGVS